MKWKNEDECIHAAETSLYLGAAGGSYIAERIVRAHNAAIQDLTDQRDKLSERVKELEAYLAARLATETEVAKLSVRKDAYEEVRRECVRLGERVKELESEHERLKANAQNDEVYIRNLRCQGVQDAVRINELEEALSSAECIHCHEWFKRDEDLQQHIRECAAHPLNQALKRINELEKKNLSITEAGNEHYQLWQSAEARAKELKKENEEHRLHVSKIMSREALLKKENDRLAKSLATANTMRRAHTPAVPPGVPSAEELWDEYLKVDTEEKAFVDWVMPRLAPYLRDKAIVAQPELTDRERQAIDALPPDGEPWMILTGDELQKYTLAKTTPPAETLEELVEIGCEAAARLAREGHALDSRKYSIAFATTILRAARPEVSVTADEAIKHGFKTHEAWLAWLNSRIRYRVDVPDDIRQRQEECYERVFLASLPNGNMSLEYCHQSAIRAARALPARLTALHAALDQKGGE